MRKAYHSPKSTRFFHKPIQTIHLWSQGFERYLGNILLSRPVAILDSEKLDEMVSKMDLNEEVYHVSFE